jgi:hypothetical protein
MLGLFFVLRFHFMRVNVSDLELNVTALFKKVYLVCVLGVTVFVQNAEWTVWLPLNKVRSES